MSTVSTVSTVAAAYDGFDGLFDGFDAYIDWFDGFDILFDGRCPITITTTRDPLHFDNILPARIPEDARRRIIDRWLRGDARDKIATDVGVATGTVSIVITEWSSQLDGYDPTALRELGQSLKRTGISPAECAQGLRRERVLNSLGIDEDKLGVFVDHLYRYAIAESNSESGAIKISQMLQQIIELVEKEPTVSSLPLDQLSSQIAQQIEQKKALDSSITEANHWKEEIASEIQEALRAKEVTMSALNEYSSLKEELAKNYGIPITSIAHIGPLLKSCEKLGYDPQNIISKLSRIESLEQKDLDLERAIKEKEKKRDEISRNNESMQRESERLKISVQLFEEQNKRLREEISAIHKESTDCMFDITEEYAKNLNELGSKANQSAYSIGEKISQYDRMMDSIIVLERSISTKYQLVLESVDKSSKLAPLLQKASGIEVSYEELLIACINAVNITLSVLHNMSPVYQRGQIFKEKLKEELARVRSTQQ